VADKGTVSVRPVSGRRDHDRFIKFPYRLRAGDPSWVPPLLIAEKELMDRKKNPFFRHAQMQEFLATRGGRVVGRIAGIDDDLHNETHRDDLAFFGFFEAEDEAVAGALYAAVEQWARDRGRRAIRGPLNPSMNDTIGFQLDAYETQPYIMMPATPPRYVRWAEGAGYQKARDLYCWYFDGRVGLTDRARKILARQRKRLDPRPEIRPMSPKTFAEDMETVRRIFSEAWKDNWGFVAPTEEEFRHAATDMKQILEWDLALILEIAGRPAGFSVTLPDINQVLRHTNGRLLPFGILKLLNRRRYMDRARLLLLGVLPEFRHKGLELMLIDRSIDNALALGYHGGECSWTLEDNDAINKAISLVGGEQYKRYRLFQKAL
jgi:GNAT superfamily N-acetyltransferase